MMDLDSANAHIVHFRDFIEKELDLNIVYHYMLKSFGELYGNTAMGLWNFGNGPNCPPNKMAFLVRRLTARRRTCNPFASMCSLQDWKGRNL
jgi:hypothetical protein